MTSLQKGAIGTLLTGGLLGIVLVAVVLEEKRRFRRKNSVPAVTQ